MIRRAAIALAVIAVAVSVGFSVYSLIRVPKHTCEGVDYPHPERPGIWIDTLLPMPVGSWWRSARFIDHNRDCTRWTQSEKPRP